MPFLDRPSGGNYDPEFDSKTGYAFPVASLAETASRNELSERDTLSHRGFKRKPCPGIEPQGGMHFPVEAWDGRRVPESGQSDGQVVERAGSEAPLLKIHLLNLATVGRIKSTAAQG